MPIKSASEKYPLRFIESSPCPYFDDMRVSTTEFVHSEGWLQSFHEYLADGYRRIGSIVYAPLCVNCSECKPLRIDTGQFRISRSQKRTERKNRDLRVEICSPSDINQQKLSLFMKYQRSKHGAGEKESSDLLTHLSCIHYGYGHIIEMDYYLEDRLVGVGIVDEAADSLSSNYFYFDTDFLDRQPGTFSILKEIALAQEMGKKYYYLGYYIKGNPKMAYKNLFRPNQMLVNGTWKEPDSARKRK
jgi:arginine-tRNA-protein transferase